MLKTNNERLQEVAEALQDLKERIVYVGGVMAGLYATDPTATEPRTTLDVDCVVNSTTYREHTAFEELLRARHFQNDQSPDAPLCRWIYKGEKVDVMSMDENVLLFGNLPKHDSIVVLKALLATVAEEDGDWIQTLRMAIEEAEERQEAPEIHSSYKISS